MQYRSVNEIAKKWNVSERSVRNYCAHGRVDGAFLTGKTWNIPENAEKPERSNKKKEQPITLLDILKEQKVSKYSGGIYHKTQIDLTYNSNHIEGSSLTHDQTRYIFETNTIGVEKEVLNVDDVIETAFLSMIFEGRFYVFPPKTYMEDSDLTIIRPLIYVSEAEVKGFRNKYQLPVVKNPCPMDGNTKREYVKKLIQQLNIDNPGVKTKLFHAIQNGNIQGWLSGTNNAI